MITETKQSESPESEIENIFKKERNKRDINNNLDDNKSEKETIEINVKEKDISDTEKKTVNIKDKDFLKGFINQQPKKAPTKTKEPFKSDDPKPTIEDLRKKLTTDDKNLGDSLDIEDFEMFADFTIEALELGTITLFRWWAIDDSDKPYEMTTKKKDKLKRLLTKILIRYAIKFPLVWLFLITLVIAHITPFRKAKLNRKDVLKQRAKKLPPKRTVQNKPASQKATEPTTNTTQTSKVDNKKVVVEEIKPNKNTNRPRKDRIIKNPAKRQPGGVNL